MNKYLRWLLVVVLISWGINHTNAQPTPGSIEYFKEITKSMNQLKGEIWQYLKAVTSGKGARKVDSKRQDLLVEIRNVKMEVSRMGPFESDASLKDAVVAYLDLSFTVLKEDFGKILDMEDIAEQSYDQMEAYLLAKEKANEKLDLAFNDLITAQDAFAAKNNIILVEGEEDKTTQKILKANETLKYYNVVYLIFFKCYKQEMYVLDALSRNDVSGVEQNSSALAGFSIEGLSKLDTLKTFHGDANLKIATQRMLRFYKKEGEEDFPALVDFFIKKDNFEKVQKSFEAKSKKDRTQEDVDQYNKAVNEYNTAAQKANKISETTDNARRQKLDDYNKYVDQFFEKHTD